MHASSGKVCAHRRARTGVTLKTASRPCAWPRRYSRPVVASPLRRSALRAGLVALISCAPLGAATYFNDDVTRLLLQRTNELRAQSGWKALKAEPRLAAAAARYARYMADTDRYGHDADGRQPAERAQAAGYAHCLTAENIAFASSTRGFEAPDLARRLFDGWVQSPPHRRNLLDGDMTDVGIAVAQSARSGKHYAVQLFGRPRAMALRIELANRSRDTVQYELAGESYELEQRQPQAQQRGRGGRIDAGAPGQRQQRPHQRQQMHPGQLAAQARHGRSMRCRGLRSDRTPARARQQRPHQPRRHGDAGSRCHIAARFQRIVQTAADLIGAAPDAVLARDQPQLGAADALVERQLRRRHAGGRQAAHRLAPWVLPRCSIRCRARDAGAWRAAQTA